MRASRFNSEVSCPGRSAARRTCGVVCCRAGAHRRREQKAWVPVLRSSVARCTASRTRPPPFHFPIRFSKQPRDMSPPCRDADCARALHRPPSRTKRAWGTSDARCTHGLVCTCSDRTHTSNNEYTGITRRSRTQWFYGLFRALPGDRACLTPSPSGYGLSAPGRADMPPKDLTPTTEASGPHDFTVRNSTVRQRAV